MRTVPSAPPVTATGVPFTAVQATLLGMPAQDPAMNVTRSRLGRLTRQGFLTQPGRGRCRKRTQSRSSRAGIGTAADATPA